MQGQVHEGHSSISQIITVSGSLTEFNKAIQECNSDSVLLFLPSKYWVVSDDVFDKAQTIFNENHIISTVYSDLHIQYEKNHCIKYHPAYSGNMTNESMINTPLFYRPLGEKVYFNEKLSALYFYDLFIKLSKRDFMYHEPEVWFGLNYEPFDIQEEIKLINEQS